MPPPPSARRAASAPATTNTGTRLVRNVANTPARAAWRMSKRNKINFPVRRQQRGKPSTRKNRSSIFTLSRQVRNLQMERYGFKQKSFQYTDGFTLNNVNPVFFALNDFYHLNHPHTNSGEIWQGAVDSTTKQAGATVIKNWKEQTWDTDIVDQSNWMGQLNKSSVSTIQYLPVSTRLRIRCAGSWTGASEVPYRFRVTIFKMNRFMAAGSDDKHFGLPKYGGAYWHLCENDPAVRNHFIPSVHKVLLDKWVTIKPNLKNTADTGTFNRFITIPFSFPANKPIRLDKHDSAEATLNQNFHDVVSQDDIIWCMISANNYAAAAGSFNPGFYLERMNVWRDPHGVAFSS